MLQRSMPMVFLSSLTILTGINSGTAGWIPVLGAVVTGLFALVVVVANRAIDRRDRRRTLYADGYRAALAWAEMPYRIRRRNPKDPYAVAARGHDLQEAIDFHQSWIESESVALGRAYRRLVSTVKAAVAEENKRAWDEPPCDPDGGFSVDLALPPSVAAAKAQFVRDMRDHLSFNPSCNFDLRERYDDRNWERIEQALADRPTTRLEPHDEGA